MDTLALIREVGPTVALVIMTALFLMKQINRGTKVIAREAHSHLDDTETLREFAKEDRELLIGVQSRNAILMDKNAELSLQVENQKGQFALFREKMSNDLRDCRERQVRQQEEIEELKAAIRELREDLLKKDETIAAQVALIKQLRAS